MDFNFQMELCSILNTPTQQVDEDPFGFPLFAPTPITPLLNIDSLSQLEAAALSDNFSAQMNSLSPLPFLSNPISDLNASPFTALSPFKNDGNVHEMNVDWTQFFSPTPVQTPFILRSQTDTPRSSAPSSPGDQATPKKKKELTDAKQSRRKMTRYQRETLIKSFEENNVPNREEKQRLSKELDIPFTAIQFWFQNRRATQRKQIARMGNVTPFQFGFDQCFI